MKKPNGCVFISVGLLFLGTMLVIPKLAISQSAGTPDSLYVGKAWTEALQKAHQFDFIQQVIQVLTKQGYYVQRDTMEENLYNRIGNPATVLVGDKAIRQAKSRRILADIRVRVVIDQDYFYEPRGREHAEIFVRDRVGKPTFNGTMLNGQDRKFRTVEQFEDSLKEIPIPAQ